MIQEKIAVITTQIADMHSELKLLQAIYDDYAVKRIWVVNVRTDSVYEDFCRRHPDIVVSRQKFTRILREELGLKTTQGWLNGVRGSFYERA